MIKLDAENGILELLVEEAELTQRQAAAQKMEPQTIGRGLFDAFRSAVNIAEKGAATVNPNDMH